MASAAEIQLYSSCADGTELDAREENARRTALPESVQILRIKDKLGEGFSFTSLGQAALAVRDMREKGLRGALACSYDRRGDVTALAFGSLE